MLGGFAARGAARVDVELRKTLKSEQIPESSRREFVHMWVP